MTTGTVDHPRAVPMTMPSTSPIAQPVRQCSVALIAVRHCVFMLRTIYPLGVSTQGLDLEFAPAPTVLTTSRKGRPMRYRTLGGTGIEVSVHCLGAMMIGSVGNPDHARLEEHTSELQSHSYIS